MYSPRLVEAHFWLALTGTVIYVFAMWNSGIIQGLMWRTYNDSGTLAYSFIDSMVAMHPYYIARTIGGLLFLIGAIVAAYNIAMTIRMARTRTIRDAAAADAPLSHPADAVVQPGE
jgi:cytochrome c oxidase cbb3-type subunit 1